MQTSDRTRVDNGEMDRYTDRFLELSKVVEKRLLTAIAVLFMLLLLFQGLLLIDGVRERLTGIDRLEGHSSVFAPSPERMLY